jgi:hypothetical protein
MDDFASATRIERLGPGRFQARIADGWQQGRGAFGGLVLGTLARAMLADEPQSDRALRTLAGDLCGPVLPGEAEIVTRVLRRGSNQTNVSAELRQGGEVLALASAVLSAPRLQPSLPRSLPLGAAPPSDWRALPVVEVAPPLFPAFAQHYEYRSLGPPFGPTAEAHAAGFVREREPVGPRRLDAPALIARLDAWWPTLFLVEGRPRPMATVSFLAEILADTASLPSTEPLHYRARLAGHYEGFCVELRELWHGEQLVALNQQTFAVIK